MASIKITEKDLLHIRDALTLYSTNAPDVVPKLSQDVREIFMDDDLDLSQLVKKTRELEALHKKAGRKAIVRELKSFFEKFPEVIAVRWTQYTPYFNDGDACIFGVNDPSVRLKDDPSGEWKGDEWEEHGKDTYSLPKGTLQTGVKELAKVLQDNGTEPILQAAFGDHVAVTANRATIEVEDYEHD